MGDSGAYRGMEEMTLSSDNRRTRFPEGTGPVGADELESWSVDDAASLKPSIAWALGWKGESRPGLAASQAALVEWSTGHLSAEASAAAGAGAGVAAGLGCSFDPQRLLNIGWS
jgi:hypothetical protein